ncbi:hypothetical protein NPIL_229991 [Nephila pilipes]|uniref:Uncharacterized protein n=1 Tax=Nephila pilipes TaxID=299642 RepID=A0A8X6K507_NEPPI|nr:hypothetical protein NPIL_229991 [Nephila pilipes]
MDEELLISMVSLQPFSSPVPGHAVSVRFAIDLYPEPPTPFLHYPGLRPVGETPGEVRAEGNRGKSRIIIGQRAHPLTSAGL